MSRSYADAEVTRILVTIILAVMGLTAPLSTHRAANAENTQAENTQAENTQAENTQAENTQAESTQAESTQAENMPDQLTIDVLFDATAHGAGVSQLGWRPGGKDELVGLWQGAWWLFDTRGGRSLLARPADFAVTHASRVTELRWSTDGRYLLVVSSESFRLFDVERRRLKRLVGDHTAVRGKDPQLSLRAPAMACAWRSCATTTYGSSTSNAASRSV